MPRTVTSCHVLPLSAEDYLLIRGDPTYEAYKADLVHQQYYGEKWLRWARKNTHTGNNSRIPERHRHKQVLEQYAHGEYEINQIFYDEYARLTAT